MCSISALHIYSSHICTKLSPESTRAQMHKYYIDYLTCYLQPMVDVLKQWLSSQ